MTVPSVAASSEGGLYPPSAFYFKVVFNGDTSDSSFQEVSGITSEMKTEDVTEGGENRFVHKLPVGMSHGNLELKRGIAMLSSPLVTWCKAVLESDFTQPIVPKDINVYLLDGEGNYIREWSFENAFPIKWEVEGFNSTKNEVAIEKISLSYTCVKRTK